LTDTSNELKKYPNNSKCQSRTGQQRHSKDEFLDTVTHELRTPITAIRASEIHDDDDIPEELRKQFCKKHHRSPIV
jgi:signal transduction histidine kinase